MAQREVERLVDRIRLQRLRVRRSVQENAVLGAVRQNVDRHPVAWMVGGATVGFIALPFLLPFVLRGPRRLARSWLTGALKGGALHLATTGLAAVQTSRAPAAATVEPSRSADGGDPDRRPEEPPLQASGGPFQPLRTS